MKPLASLSLDLDNEWAYIKTHGDPAWETFPSYFDIVVPRFLEVLDRLGQRITVFIVGQDAALEKNHAALRSIADAGHEIGNHSFHHEPWLQRYSDEQIEREIRSATEAIAGCDRDPAAGFSRTRGSASRATLETLAIKDTATTARRSRRTSGRWLARTIS
jgi:peptidoglycan/xylan/chitin deacetylase (PgdA/CDA1 family)